MQSSKNKLSELKAIITRMSLNTVWAAVVPEFGLKWLDVSRAVRNARLPMQSSSVAQVLCQHAARTLSQDELQNILGLLRLQLVATQPRTWHVIRLLEPTTEEPVMVTLKTLPHRILSALRNGKHRNMRPQVQSLLAGDLVYIGIQFVSQARQSPVLYLCTPPGEPVALLTSLANKSLVKACVEGLGYVQHEDAALHGQDIPSLLRIADHAWAAPADQLLHAPEYNPTPTLTTNGIDYTNRDYDEMYVENLLGPNPPLLTEITVKCNHPFFDRSRLDKTINLTMTLKSDDVSQTLKSWVAKGAIAPTSEFLKIFHQIKSNKIQYNGDEYETE